MPADGNKVKMYVCGITPYSDAHLGHARCYVVFDTLRRYLEYAGYDVFYVQNITDIDDKIINKSRETGMKPADIADRYFNEFMESMKKLNVRPADVYPRVSETIGDIIDFISGLIDKEMAYESGGDVYFSVGKFDGYGKLSGRDSSELVSSAECATGRKGDARDFALWKKDEEFGWDSPWGKGRPGWHIECSAMSRKLLGEQFDIHGGGLDLIFPHHENEVTQSKALTGKDPVRYWVHNGMVTLKGDKMAKSTGNFFLLKDLLEKYPAMAVRLYLLTSGYRQTLDFSAEGLLDVRKAYDKLAGFKKEILQLTRAGALPGAERDEDMVRIMNDDFNTAKAIGEIFKKVNPIMDAVFEGKTSDEDIALGGRLIYFVENVLGVLLDTVSDVDTLEVEDMLRKREEFRKQKNYSEADGIRQQLARMGIEIKDTPAGAKWFKKGGSTE